ncbi:hypothetical protein M6B38_371890 [Iris pallida]|uniref:Uncharacterized protein n=1 Tax=Iris pallida TaxID=29817 RepID=A0AAX6GDN0_IRIPA|nr:hypothetical protein M6B38_371890 [Iris pallida]
MITTTMGRPSASAPLRHDEQSHIPSKPPPVGTLDSGDFLVDPTRTSE